MCCTHASIDDSMYLALCIAGARAGNTEKALDTTVGEPGARGSTDQLFLKGKKHDGFPIKNVGNDGMGIMFTRERNMERRNGD